MMADNKKYYYIKLKENYFDQDNVKILESMSNGHIYSLIILKLYLKSCKGAGKLMMTDIIPYDYGKTEILAKVIGHDPSHVREAIQAGIKLDLITITESAEIWMNEMMNMIGLSSSEGDRKRIYRQKLIQIKDKTRTKDRQVSGQTSTRDRKDKRPPEIEKELKKEIDRELELEGEYPPQNPNDYPDTYPFDDDFDIQYDNSEGEPIPPDDADSLSFFPPVENSRKQETDTIRQYAHTVCNDFAKDFNKRYGQAIGGHIGYTKAVDIFNNSPDPKLLFSQIPEARKRFFEIPDFYNTEPPDKKTILWRKCTLPNFLANLPRITAACQQDKKQRKEKPYDKMTKEEQYRYRENVKKQLEAEGKKGISG